MPFDIIIASLRDLWCNESVRAVSNLTYSWNLGDYSGYAYEPAVVHTLELRDSYLVMLKVRDDFGQLAVDYLTLQVGPSTPTAPTTWGSIKRGSPLLKSGAFPDGPQCHRRKELQHTLPAIQGYCIRITLVVALKSPATIRSR